MDEVDRRERAESAARLVIASSVLWPPLRAWAMVTGATDVDRVIDDVKSLVGRALADEDVRASAVERYASIEELIPPADTYDEPSRRWELLANSALGALGVAAGVLAGSSLEIVPRAVEDVLGAVETEARWAQSQLRAVGEERRLSWASEARAMLDRALALGKRASIEHACSSLERDGPPWWLELQQIERRSPAPLAGA